MKSSKANLVTSTFYLPPKRQVNFSFHLQIFHIFSQVLNFTSVELNRFAKQGTFSKKTLFFKGDGGHAISRQEKRRLPKSIARFPAKKRWHSPPPVGLSWDSPPPLPESVRTGGRTLTSQPKFLGSTKFA